MAFILVRLWRHMLHEVGWYDVMEDVNSSMWVGGALACVGGHHIDRLLHSPVVPARSGMTSGDEGSKAQPQTPVLTVGCRMLRSPSHESVTTDLSLFSVSSIASEAASRAVKLVTFKPYTDMAGRGPSPNPDSKGQTHAR